jgi:hypothetical protein
MVAKVLEVHRLGRPLIPRAAAVKTASDVALSASSLVMDQIHFSIPHFASYSAFPHCWCTHGTSGLQRGQFG